MTCSEFSKAVLVLTVLRKSGRTRTVFVGVVHLLPQPVIRVILLGDLGNETTRVFPRFRVVEYYPWCAWQNQGLCAQLPMDYAATALYKHTIIGLLECLKS
jgi:hypothetical protein